MIKLLLKQRLQHSLWKPIDWVNLKNFRRKKQLSNLLNPLKLKRLLHQLYQAKGEADKANEIASTHELGA